MDFRRTMKKLLLALFLFVAGFNAEAADYYYCNCSTFSHGSCVNGSDGAAGSSGAPYQTTAQLKTKINTGGAAGDRHKLCAGGDWSGVNVANLYAPWSTRTNPVVIESYTPSWMPAACTDTGTGAVTYSATGLTDTGKAWGVNALAGCAVRVNGLQGNMKYRIASNTATAITLAGTTEHPTTEWALTPSAGATYTIEPTRPILRTLGQSGISLHDLSTPDPDEGYIIQGLEIRGAEVAAVAISSMSGTGTVATIDTATPHGLVTNMNVWVSGASVSAFNNTTAARPITVVDADTFTFGCPAGSGCTGSPTGATYEVHAAYGVYTIANVDYVTIEDNLIHGNGAGMYIQGLSSASPEDVQRSDYFKIVNNQFEFNHAIGLAAGGTQELIEHNIFSRNGVSAFDHQIYVLSSSGTPVFTTNITQIRGNLFLNGNIGALGTCVGVQIVWHGHQKALTIENNTLWEQTPPSGAGCWGLAGGAGYSSEEAFDDLIIRGNRIINASGMGIGIDNQRKGIIENNEIVLMNGTGGANCIMFRQTNASVQNSLHVNDTLSADIHIRNNSCYIEAATVSTEAIRIRKNAADVSIPRIQVHHNSIHFGAASTGVPKCFATTNWSMSDIDYWNYNACYNQAGGGVTWDATSQILAAGFDANRVTTAITLSATPATSNGHSLAPASGSSVNGAGDATKTPRLAYDGCAQTSPPAIGARPYRASGCANPAPSPPYWIR
jgi:hypothetical protein